MGACGGCLCRRNVQCWCGQREQRFYSTPCPYNTSCLQDPSSSSVKGKALIKIRHWSWARVSCLGQHMKNIALGQKRAALENEIVSCWHFNSFWHIRMTPPQFHLPSNYPVTLVLPKSPRFFNTSIKIQAGGSDSLMDKFGQKHIMLPGQ